MHCLVLVCFQKKLLVFSIKLSKLFLNIVCMIFTWFLVLSVRSSQVIEISPVKITPNKSILLFLCFSVLDRQYSSEWWCLILPAISSKQCADYTTQWLLISKHSLTVCIDLSVHNSSTYTTIIPKVNTFNS